MSYIFLGRISKSSFNYRGENSKKKIIRLHRKQPLQATSAGKEYSFWSIRYAFSTSRLASLPSRIINVLCSTLLIHATISFKFWKKKILFQYAHRKCGTPLVKIKQTNNDGNYTLSWFKNINMMILFYFKITLNNISNTRLGFNFEFYINSEIII